MTKILDDHYNWNYKNDLPPRKKNKTWQIDIWLFCFQQINNWGRFISQVIQNIIMIREKTKTLKNNV